MAFAGSQLLGASRGSLAGTRISPASTSRVSCNSSVKQQEEHGKGFAELAVPRRLHPLADAACPQRSLCALALLAVESGKVENEALCFVASCGLRKDATRLWHAGAWEEVGALGD